VTASSGFFRRVARSRARTSTASSSWDFAIHSVGFGGFVRASCGWGQPDKVFVLASYKQLSSVLRSSSEVLMISLVGLRSKMG